jgi:hypothetical protein
MHGRALRKYFKRAEICFLSELPANKHYVKFGRERSRMVSLYVEAGPSFQSFANIILVTDNLRYALDSCLFNFANASDAESTVCSTSQACRPLQTALEDGNLIPTNESEYSYCNADDNAFRGTYLASCESCFQNTDDQKYLRNCKYSPSLRFRAIPSLVSADRILSSSHCP